MSLVKTQAFVTSIIPYNDKNSVVKFLTQHYGIKTFLVPISKNTKSRFHSALFNYCNLLQITFHNHNTKNILRLNELELVFCFRNIMQNVVKSSLLFFEIELFNKSIKEIEEYSKEFDFMHNSIQFLDNENNYSNLNHVPCFYALNLLKILGFAANTDNIQQHNTFDLQQGVFLPQNQPCFFKMNSVVMPYFKALLLVEEISQIPMVDKTTRKLLLNDILIYFELHVPSFSKPKSVEILNELFT
jgi:DNA repair protein RecO (recombination protein O)